MIVLITLDHDEIKEIVGPFKDSDEAEQYFEARLTHEPNFRAEHHEVNEPLVMRRWRGVDPCGHVKEPT